MKSLIVLVVLCVPALAERLEKALEAEEASGRIVEGVDASWDDFPHMISLHINDHHVCGGSILTVRWVVTAAHCVDSVPIDSMIVYAGVLDQDEIHHPDVQARRVRGILVHESYKSSKLGPYDIALLELRSSLNIIEEVVEAIDLPQQGEEFHGPVWVCGWGELGYSNPIPPTALQKVELEVWRFDECRTRLGHHMPNNDLDETQICLGKLAHARESTCFGDSGGPAVKDGKLVGISSWHIKPCGEFDRVPSIFVDVSKFVTWIEARISIDLGEE